MSRHVTVNMVEGLHVRPISMIVNVVNDAGCQVLIRFGEKQVEANSQLNLMLLAAPQGSELELLADGDGAEQVLDHLENLFLTNFEVEGTTESEQVY
ncbi:MAG: HPr family phosphocarrier protein [Planctomycetaceae bacterium]